MQVISVLSGGQEQKNEDCRRQPVNFRMEIVIKWEWYGRNNDDDDDGAFCCLGDPCESARMVM